MTKVQTELDWGYLNAQMSKHYWNIILSVVGVVLCFVYLSSPMNWIVSIILFLLFSSFLALGISFIQLNYFFKAINRLDNDKVLLTFDDGPDEKYTLEIVNVLKKHQVAAVFFVIGEKAIKNPELVNQVIENGHLVGNHTADHPNNFALLSQNLVEEQITKGQKQIKTIKGSSPFLFRTPIGVTNPIIARAVRKTQVTVIGWTIRTKDTQQKDGEKWIKRIIEKTRPNDIILFHDTQPITVKHLDYYLIESKKRGIEFVNTETIKTLFHA